jgi:hypothetical protein
MSRCASRPALFAGEGIIFLPPTAAGRGEAFGSVENTQKWCDAQGHAQPIMQLASQQRSDTSLLRFSQA